MCVMLVEDEPYLRTIVSEMLTDEGHTVVEFGSVPEAKVYVATPENWLTTVLTDINMPGEQTGLDLAVFVRKTRPTVKVIVMSGRYDALPLGLPDGIGFLPKPWSMESLLELVGNVQVRRP